MEAAVADLQKQLSKKSTFQTAATALTTIFRDQYSVASPVEQKQMYAAACRAATLLQTRYTGRGFWVTGRNLFQQVLAVTKNAEEQEHMRKCVFQAYEFLGEEGLRDELRIENPQHAGPSSRFLFDGQLTVGNEPPPPAWLIAQNALTALSAARDHSENEAQIPENMANEIQDLMQRLTSLQEFTPGLEEAIQATMQDLANAPTKGPPPASKEEVAKLPIIQVTEQVLKDVGHGTECAVCREVLVCSDTMQEMPCKHYFHPPCLKPWLDEHNSCPICRFEMRTDDHEYESRKEREREAEIERKGAANAVAGLPMYI